MSEVAREPLHLLERQEQDRNEAIQQLKADLQIGIDQADRGELIDGTQAFETLRLMIESQANKSASSRSRPNVTEPRA